jgi:hypothetical protein
MLVPSVLNCYTKVINKLKPEEATHAHVSSLSLSRRKPAALKGEERGAMRMLSKACSIVASSLPRSPLSPSLSPRVFLFLLINDGSRPGFGSGIAGLPPVRVTVICNYLRASATILAFLHGRPSFCLVIAGTHNCLFITVS